MEVPQQKGILGRPDDAAPNQHHALEAGLSLQEKLASVLPLAWGSEKEILLKGKDALGTECTEAHPKGIDFI